jgi:hypothetical protein
LPGLKHSNQRAKIPVSRGVNLFDIHGFRGWVGDFVIPIARSVANPILIGIQEKRWDDLHAIAIETDHDHLAIAFHFGTRIGVGKNALDFLKQSGLTVPDAILIPIIDTGGKQKIHIHIARGTGRRILSP